MEKKPQFTGPRRPAGSAPRPPRPAAPAPQGGGRGGRKGTNDRNSKDPYVINDHIRAKEVRLVGDNVEQGIYPIEKALRIAEKMELDLIEISPNAEPPVCRILDYQKFLYQQKKRLKEQKQKMEKFL